MQPDIRPVASPIQAARRGITLGAVLLLGLAACSPTDPDPSPLYDGRYVGTRRSDLPQACGIPQPQGTISAFVTAGHLAMPLFGPRTQLTGTVGQDGRLRASGIWANPTKGFPGVTVLDGRISDNVLDGTATDFRCHTDVHLRRIVPGQPSSGAGTARRP